MLKAKDFQVRHDMFGYYNCTQAEADYEDGCGEDETEHESVGFDGRPHYATRKEACLAIDPTNENPLKAVTIFVSFLAMVPVDTDLENIDLNLSLRDLKVLEQQSFNREIENSEVLVCSVTKVVER